MDAILKQLKILARTLDKPDGREVMKVVRCFQNVLAKMNDAATRTAAVMEFNRHYYKAIVFDLEATRRERDMACERR